MYAHITLYRPNSKNLCDYLLFSFQTFEVELFEVTSGGATLGPYNSVLVGILPNDSPTGVFSFVSLQVRMEHYNVVQHFKKCS